MKELIKIENRKIGDEMMQTVDARELHAFLGLKQDFSKWIGSRIKRYGLVQELDYCKHKKFIKHPTGAKKRIEYNLSIDIAKSLSRFERTGRGHQALRYFIEYERRLKEQTKLFFLETEQRIARFEKKQMDQNRRLSAIEQQWEEELKHYPDDLREFVEAFLDDVESNGHLNELYAMALQMFKTKPYVVK